MNLMTKLRSLLGLEEDPGQTDEDVTTDNTTTDDTTTDVVTEIGEPASVIPDGPVNQIEQIDHSTPETP